MLDTLYITNYINYGYAGNVPTTVKRNRYRQLATILAYRMPEMSTAELLASVNQYNVLLTYAKAAN